MAGAHPFLLGLASGIAVLAITSYRHVSPPWLKWWLVATGILLIARYALLAAPPTVEPSDAAWSARLLWCAGAAGFTTPGIFAVDQLLRHPAMTPLKLLRWCALLLVLYAAACPWLRLAIIVQGLVALGLLGFCVMLSRHIPPSALRRSVLVLGIGYGVWGVASLAGSWRLASELLLLVVLWSTFEASATAS